MTMARVGNTIRRFASELLLLGALALTVVAYSPGLRGTIHFDDPPSLDGLQQIVDWQSALRFTLDGMAGPLGRPLALASFVPQGYAWPTSPETMLYVNVCLHLLNGSLVAWLLYRLGRAHGYAERQAAWIAAASAAIWMVTPLLASSSLLIIQRMTTLSATFSLVGAIGYLVARQRLEQRPVVALAVMSLGVGLGTTCAVLTKENGALLPVMLLVAELTLLPAPQQRDVYRKLLVWRTIFLGLPAAAIAFYLVQNVDPNPAIAMTRGFAVLERLLTEAHILWKYLYLGFVPSTTQLGPFHDDYVVQTNWLAPHSVLAVGSWIICIVAATVLRRRMPLLSFAVGWYLVGHAIESTTIPLELYFEHRNYLPLIGPVFGLVAAVSTANLPQIYVRSGLVAYIVVLAVSLLNFTSLWGNPPLAAEMWAIHHPDSMRANQYLALRIQDTGDYATVRRVLRRYLERDPLNAGVQMQVLALSCELEPEQPQPHLVRSIEESLRQPTFQRGAFEGLRGLYRIAEQEDCLAVDRPTVYRLASIAADNPAFQAVPTEHHNLHVLMAEEGFAQRNLDLTMQHLEAALNSNYTMSTLLVAVNMLSSAGLHSAAQDFAHEAAKHRPSNPLRAAAWTKQVEAVEAAIQIAANE